MLYIIVNLARFFLLLFFSVCRFVFELLSLFLLFWTSLLTMQLPGGGARQKPKVELMEKPQAVEPKRNIHHHKRVGEGHHHKRVGEEGVGHQQHHMDGGIIGVRGSSDI